jgi:hypothetical protein
MASRRLVSLRRPIPEAVVERYDELWLALAAEVRALDAHAWRFASASDRDLRLEFLEFAAARDPRELPPVRELLHRLDVEIASASAEEWDER